MMMVMVAIFYLNLKVRPEQACLQCRQNPTSLGNQLITVRYLHDIHSVKVEEINDDFDDMDDDIESFRCVCY